MKAQKQASATYEELKRQIGRYSIERLLARGGMAEVFIGRALGPAGFSKRVVIKRILPNLAQNGEFISMFMNEAKLAALLDHPNIVQVFDFGRHSSTYYIAMEYVEGENLRTIMLYYAAQQRRIPVAPILVWVQGVCEALAYAHKLKAENGDCYNIVHRDISPDNILVSNSGIAKVVDFGVARASTLQRDLTTAGVVKGKFAYIAPEQILGQPVDQRVDIYSLGVTLYEVLVGRRPHVASNDLELVYSIMNTDPEPPHLAQPEIDPQLSNIISRTIARDPKDRYPDMLAVHADIDDYLKSRGLRVKRSELSEIVAQVSQWSVNSVRNRELDSSSWNWDDWECEEEAPSTMVFAAEGTNPTTILSKPGAQTSDQAALGGARRKLGLGILFVSLLAVVIAGGLIVLQRSSPPAPVTTPTTAPVATPITTPEAKPVTTMDSPKEDPVSASQSSVSASQSQPSSSVKIPIVAPENETKSTVKSSPKPAKEKHRVASARTKPAKVKAKVKVKVNDSLAAVQTTSLTRLDVAKEPVVPTTAAEPKRLESSQSSSLSATQLSPAPREVSGDGWLNLRTEPWCDVYLRGERIGTTPLNHLLFPAGKYWLKLVNKSAGIEKAIQVEIRPGEVATTRIRLSK